jgi:hypothetical protein
MVTVTKLKKLTLGGGMATFYVSQGWQMAAPVGRLPEW